MAVESRQPFQSEKCKKIFTHLHKEPFVVNKPDKYPDTNDVQMFQLF